MVFAIILVMVILIVFVMALMRVATSVDLHRELEDSREKP